MVVALEGSVTHELDFDGTDSTYPFGSHVSVVEVDTETGGVTMLRHVAVDDCGRILNPLLVRGQQHGGIAQGAAQALYEHVMAGSSPFSGFREGMALMYLEAGRVDDAIDALGDRRDFPPMPRDWSWLYLSCLQAEVCAHIGDDVTRRRLCDELAPFADQLAVIGTGVGCWGPVAYYVGLLEAALGRADAAERWLREAIAMADRMNAPPWRERASAALLAVH